MAVLISWRDCQEDELMSAETGMAQTFDLGPGIEHVQVDLPRGASLEIKTVTDGLETVAGIVVPKLVLEGEEEEFSWQVATNQLHVRQNDGNHYLLPGGGTIGSDKQFVAGISPDIRPKATLLTPGPQAGGYVEHLSVYGGSRITIEGLAGNYLLVKQAGSIALRDLTMRLIHAQTRDTGGITLQAVRADNVTARTYRGDIVVTGGGTSFSNPEDEEGGWKLHAFSGDIVYRDPPYGVVDATSMTGKLRINLPQPE